MMAQQHLNMASQAATVQGVNLLYTLDTAADAVSTSKVNPDDVLSNSTLRRLLNLPNGG